MRRPDRCRRDLQGLISSNPVLSVLVPSIFHHPTLSSRLLLLSPSLLLSSRELWPCPRELFYAHYIRLDRIDRPLSAKEEDSYLHIRGQRKEGFSDATKTIHPLRQRTGHQTGRESGRNKYEKRQMMSLLCPGPGLTSNLSLRKASSIHAFLWLSSAFSLSAFSSSSPRPPLPSLFWDPTPVEEEKGKLFAPAAPPPSPAETDCPGCGWSIDVAPTLAEEAAESCGPVLLRRSGAVEVVAARVGSGVELSAG